jgi:hypothetical protein
MAAGLCGGTVGIGGTRAVVEGTRDSAASGGSHWPRVFSLVLTLFKKKRSGNRLFRPSPSENRKVGSWPNLNGDRV